MRLRFFIALVMLGSCIDAPCDPDQRFAEGVCFIIPPDAAPASEQADGAPSVALGTICVTTADCAGATNLCAIQPGAPSGFCTHDGCKEQPTVCPATATCLDLDAFSPGLSICLAGT